MSDVSISFVFLACLKGSVKQRKEKDRSIEQDTRHAVRHPTSVASVELSLIRNLMLCLLTSVLFFLSLGVEERKGKVRQSWAKGTNGTG